MSKNEIVSLIETMNNYDELASKAKAKADAIRDALKEEMLRLDTEELNAGAYILRYHRWFSSQPDIPEEFSKTDRGCVRIGDSYSRRSNNYNQRLDRFNPYGD